jgi:hypothetical protein
MPEKKQAGQRHWEGKYEEQQAVYATWIRRIPTFKEQPRGPSDAGERALLIL